MTDQNKAYLSANHLVVLHVALISVLATWAIGGGSSQAVLAISILGSIAPLLTLLTWRERRRSGQTTANRLALLLPLLGLNLLVVLGTLQPALRTATIEGGSVYILRKDLTAWPCSAQPETALQELWLLNAIVLSSFNLILAVQRRQTLRTLLLFLAANALFLSIFGSIQKFVNAPGLFFGSIASPNPTFFASFIYRNHWGAFVILMLAGSLGLLFNLRPWTGYRDFWHSPAVAAVVAVFLLSLTLPLSGSRACTMLGLVLLTCALVQGLVRVIRYRSAENRSVVTAGIGIGLTCMIALVLTLILARPAIEDRINLTQEQFAHMREIGGLGARSELYHDTFRMAKDRIWFGWGPSSYGTVFLFYNNQHAIDGLPQYYEDAHSDWLQSLAETGVIGFTLQLLLLLAPLQLIRSPRSMSSLPRYLLGGCGLILLYACIEFPFGNPAVTLTFWTCWVCAVRYHDLEAAAAS